MGGKEEVGKMVSFAVSLLLFASSMAISAVLH